MKLYHGTLAPFAQFDSVLLGDNTVGNATSEALEQSALIGFWFTTGVSKMLRTTYPVVMTCEVEVSNPLSIANLSEMESLIDNLGSGAAVREWAEGEGYDSIEIYRDEEFGYTSYIVWDTDLITIK